ISNYAFGGVILFAGNLKTTRAASELISDLQSSALSSRNHIPLLLSVDQEGGYVARLGTGTTMPGNMALAATGEEDNAKKSAAVIGKELASLGMNVDFAPVMDVNNDPSNPVIGLRSFSDDAEICASFGKAFIEGLHSEGVAAALKHFPGHGDTGTDSHTGLPSIKKSLDELRASELVPFRAGIAAGADIVMTAHIAEPAIEKETCISKSTGEEITIPATLSKTFITDILRGELGFSGVVSTDAMNMAAISEHFDPMDAARLAINAGVDILLMPLTVTKPEDIPQFDAYITGIAGMVDSGAIAQKTIDDAVLRILKLKEKYGLLDDFKVDKEANVIRALTSVGSEENHAVEWEIAQKAVTLVKNEHKTLPLSLMEGEKAALFCSYNNEVNCMHHAVERLRSGNTLASGAQPTVMSDESLSLRTDEMKKAVEEAKFILASVETYRAANITGGWQASFLDELIGFAHGLGKRVVIVSIQLPYDLARYQKADAPLAAYSAVGMDVMPTEYYKGETKTYGPNLPAAVYVAFGGAEAGGKLPVDIPKLDDKLAYTSEILYPRGYAFIPNGEETDESALKLELSKFTMVPEGKEHALSGIVTSNYRLASVKAEIRHGNQTVKSAVSYPDDYRFDLAEGKLGEKAGFEALDEGMYVFSLTASDLSGRKVETSFVFTVKDVSEDPSRIRITMGDIGVVRPGGSIRTACLVASNYRVTKVTVSLLGGGERLYEKSAAPGRCLVPVLFRDVDLRSLPAGRYTLRVTASDESGNMLSRDNVFRIAVKDPYPHLTMAHQ
ncbi:MAG: glycoside hydrolase family 3 protein, partial [Clostridia bacterium]|nr:glycoside hydrolase family 3 protein [Clostridia bacterium]